MVLPSSTRYTGRMNPALREESGKPRRGIASENRLQFFVMINRCLVAFALMFASGSAIAGWDAKVVPKTTAVVGDRYVLIYHPEVDRGAQTIGEAVGKLAKSGHIAALQTITIHELVPDETFQKEIFEQLEKNAPQVLGAARQSAGNMHNPKMVALRADFARAVMGTPTVTGISKALAAQGMKISRPSFEKLELRKEEQGPRFRCFLWLSVETLATAPEGATAPP